MDQPSRKDEFLQLAARHQGELFSYIYALLRNLHDTEDVHQQTLMTLWQKFDDYQSGTNFIAWAVRTAQVEVLRFRDQRKRSAAVGSQQLLLDLAEPYVRESAAAETTARRGALDGCLKKLPSGDRELIDQCYRSGSKLKDVAADLGRSQQSLSNSLRRIRGSLHQCIQHTLEREQRP